MAETDRLNGFESMCCAEIGKVVMDFASVYKAEKSARACLLNFFSLVAALLAAEEGNLSRKSECCARACHPVAMTGGIISEPVTAIVMPLAPFFLAASLSCA